MRGKLKKSAGPLMSEELSYAKQANFPGKSIMKKCPLCAQRLQDEAHHCHHCNSMIVDMDGNPVVAQGSDKTALRQSEWLEKVMKVLVTIFFTVQFFIDGLI